MSHTHSPKIAIIVLNWNGLRNTMNCIESLIKVDYPNYSVIVVDNNSSEEERKEIKALEKRGRISVILNSENIGFASGNNVAILKALEDTEIEYVATLNNDTVVKSDFLSELIQTAMANPRAGMVAPTIMEMDGNKIDRLGILATRDSLPHNRHSLAEGAIFCPSGCCAIYSRKLLETVLEHTGCFFDPDFFCYVEDFDLGFRAQILGFSSVFAASSVVYHIGSASTTNNKDFALYHFHRNILWSIAKNYPGGLFWPNIFWILIAQLWGVGKRIGRKDFSVVLRAKWDGIKGIRRMLSKRRQIQNSRAASNARIRSLMVSPPVYFLRKKQKMQ